MAEVKWIKITTDMFDNRKIKHLRRLPDGNNIVLIWVMLLTMAGRCNASGMIFLTQNIPYTPKMLADELDFEENTVQLALQALEKLGMIITNNGFFSIAGWEEYQNVEGLDKIREQNRIRKQNQRKREKLLIEDSHVKSRDGHATDIEEDIDIEKEKDKELDKKKSKCKRENTRTLFDRLINDYIISDYLAAKMTEWITYKMERKESYKEQGMKSLLRQVENQALTHGDEKVVNLIDECMANNWKGIIWDRLNKPTQTVQTTADRIANRVSEVDNW